MTTQLPLPSYQPLSPPPGASIDPVYLLRELQAIGRAVANLSIMTPQAATTEPPIVFDGMQRLARSPWWPASGQTSDAWVYFDAPTGSWKLL